MEERRQSGPIVYLKEPDLSYRDPRVSAGKFTPALQIVRLMSDDLLSSKGRSREFNDTRADYLRLRVRGLALLVLILLVLWIPIDFITLETELAVDLAWLRIAIATVIGCIAHFTRPSKEDALVHVQIMLTSLILAMNVFMLAAQLILLESSSREAIYGYSLFPYLYITALSIFPQTAVEGLRLSAITVLFVAAKHLIHGELDSFVALSEFWFLILLTAVVLWSQMGQLHMLLRLYRQATRDPLTGLFNRIRLIKNIMHAKEQVDKNNNAHFLAVMMFDLDNFKRINDGYGHTAGDEVLKSFAAVLGKTLRSTDIFGRYGGEEFLSALVGANAEEVMAVAERIRRACENTPVTTRNGEEIRFTTSIGVAFYQKGEDIGALIDRADKNLYRAKTEGRNRAVLSSQPLEQPTQCTS